MSNGNKSGRALAVMGVLSVLAGLLAMGSPLWTGAFVTSVVGALLLINGLLELMCAFSADGWKAGLLAFLGGALALLAGGMILARPVIGSVVIGAALIVFFFADGMARTLLAFKLKPRVGWGWTLTGGVLSLILGAMLWRGWPLSGMWAVGVLVGTRILFAGIALLILRGAVQRIEKVA